MNKDPAEVIAFLAGKIGEDIVGANYSEIIAKVSQLDSRGQEDILATCIAALGSERGKQNKITRIAAVRAIVALLPLSLEPIAAFLCRHTSKHDYEVHFTLFCYLDWAQEMPDAPILTKEVLQLVENYVMTVSRPTARAAWMAADMLGSHWHEQEAALLLIKTAKKASFVVGRRLSILGLEKLLERASSSSGTHKAVLEALYKMSSFDRSKYVKEDAKAALICGQKNEQRPKP